MKGRIYFLIFTQVLTCSLVVASIVRAIWFFGLVTLTAKKLHEKMLKSVIGTKIRFFDLNPIGRVINRFSNDIGNIDDLLPITMFDTIQVGLTVAAD
jgi:ATP-binding cassette subfamily C (CFTR/MRP) protein 4